MKNISIIIIALLSLSIISCNPDYTKAQELEGTWDITEIKNGTITTTYPYTILGVTYSSSMKFHDVKEDGGTLTQTTKVGNTSTDFTEEFTIIEKGTKIVLDNSVVNFTVNTKELIFENDNSTITLKKQ